MEYIVTIYQNCKYRGVIQAKDADEAYAKAQDIVIEEPLPNSAFEWVNEDIDIDVCAE